MSLKLQAQKLRPIARKLLYNDLPLGGARLVLMLLCNVFAIVTGAFCVKLWSKHHSTQKLLNANLPSGTSAVLEYQDVRATSIVLFVANQLPTFASSHIVMIMLHDLFKIIPAFALRRFSLPKEPLSTVTLPHQAVAMVLSTIFLIIASVLHTDFVFTRTTMLSVHQGSTEVPASTVQGTLDRLGIALPYRDVDYIRISSEVSIPMMFFSLAGTVATLVAWYQYRRTPPAPSIEDSASESVEAEKAEDKEIFQPVV